jgi:hypothetical protein
LSAHVLRWMLCQMLDSHSNCSLPYGFNHAWLVLLPKKVSGHNAKGDFYHPQNMRPLSIVSSGNRLIANLLRKKIEKLADNLIKDHQRGFLWKRLITANIIDIDVHSLQVRLNHTSGAIVLFDFNAAFPSLNHEYLWSVLAHIKLAPHVIGAIRCLYEDNQHYMQIGGKLFNSFKVGSGVRQGCPLSPLLFVIAIGPFLTKLANMLPSLSVLRAFVASSANTLQKTGQSLFSYSPSSHLFLASPST